MAMTMTRPCSRTLTPTSAHPRDRAGAATTMMRRQVFTLMAESPRAKNARRSSVS